MAENDKPLTKRFVQLLIDNFTLETDPWPQGIFIEFVQIQIILFKGDEPIYKDGVVCGWTTSAAYGFTLGSQVIF